MAREHGLTPDRVAFGCRDGPAAARARASWKGAEKGTVVPAYQKLIEQARTSFWDTAIFTATSRVIGLIVDRQAVDRIGAGTKAELVFDQTPFYAEAGGQVGDHGVLYSESGENVADVETAFPGVPGLTVHRIVAHAAIAVGDVLRAESLRHCATPPGAIRPLTCYMHHCADSARTSNGRAASSIRRLRFDFNHYAAMDKAEHDEGQAPDEPARS
jgi:alanyl-tRNA synthetase